MHKNTSVAALTFDDETATITAVGSIFEPVHLPVSVITQNNKTIKNSLIRWWNRRSIPASRSGLRELLETLHIHSIPRMLKECYGLSLSDQYWICPENSELTWERINFFDNPFSEDIGNILFGGKISDQKPNLISPDSTSDGQLKKRWKIIDGVRCLVKGRSRPFYQEPLNEVISSTILRRLNIPHVDYAILWEDDLPYSVCPDFIGGFY